MTPLLIIVGYLGLLLTLGMLSTRLFRGTSRDYFIASNTIGPFLLLMSVFGTTMTGFALVGSTGKAVIVCLVGWVAYMVVVFLLVAVFGISAALT